MKPISPDKFAEIDQAAHSGAFGNNPIPLPTDKQKQAGNYKKGKFSWQGLTIAIEQPQNTYRTGLDDNGNRWSCRLAANYGYILGTKGNDKDHVDCFVGSYPQAERVYVVNQYVNGVFDEHKTMLCYPFLELAISDYNHSYSRDWQGLHDIQDISIKQFKWWLKNGDMTKPLNKADLPAEDVTDMRRIFWDGVNPVDTDFTQLHYELSRIDSDDKLLTDSVSVADFYMDADKGSVAILDSLHTPYVALGRICSKIMAAMKAAGSGLQDVNGNQLLPVESTPDAPNPSGLDTTFKRNGVVNLAAVFELTDGQSFTIVFHNPDSTPGKLNNSDTLIAWKFLLNKRDITIVVAPEKGEDLKLPEVAKRVMNLAAKNSRAFARAESTKAENAKKINDLKTEIAGLEEEKKVAVSEYEATKADYDDWLIAKSQESKPPKPAFVATHTVDDDGVKVPVKMNDDGVWESENGNEYQDYDAEPIVQSVGQIDSEKAQQLYYDIWDNLVVKHTTEIDRLINGKIQDWGSFELFIKSTQPAQPAVSLMLVNETNAKSALVTNAAIALAVQEAMETHEKTPEFSDAINRVNLRIYNTSNDEASFGGYGWYQSVKQWIAGKSAQSTGQNSQPIDPATLANINASSLSAALKKKAIAFFEKNPGAKSFEDSGLSRASQATIAKNTIDLLIAETKKLSGAIRVKEPTPGLQMLVIGSIEKESFLFETALYPKGKTVATLAFDTQVTYLHNNRLILDGVDTLEQLKERYPSVKSGGFYPLPLDLNVKDFVQNVIKPVVDEFLSKQQAVTPEEPENVIEPEPIPTETEPQPPAQPENNANDPESELRALWTKQGVSKERQDELIGQLSGKTQELQDMFKPEKKVIAALKNGDLKTALDILNSLNKEPLMQTLLKSGFELADTGTVKSLMAYIEPQLIRAAKNKTDGFGLREMDNKTKKVEKAHSDWLGWYRNTTGEFPSDKLSQEAYQKAQNGDDLTGFGALPAKKTEASPTAEIDAEIESLRTETDNDRFNARLDELAAKIEEVGLMDKYDAELNELADIAAQMAIENSKKVGG